MVTRIGFRGVLAACEGVVEEIQAIRDAASPTSCQRLPMKDTAEPAMNANVWLPVLVVPQHQDGRDMYVPRGNGLRLMHGCHGYWVRWMSPAGFLSVFTDGDGVCPNQPVESAAVERRETDGQSRPRGPRVWQVCTRPAVRGQ